MHSQDISVRQTSVLLSHMLSHTVNVSITEIHFLRLEYSSNTN